MSSGWTKPKPRTHQFVCVICKEPSSAADYKAMYCKKCVATYRPLCRCGCGKRVNTHLAKYLLGHAIRDKQNSAIITGRRIQGRKISGANNPSKRGDVRRKISSSLRGKCCWKLHKTKDEIVATAKKLMDNRRGKGRVALRFKDSTGKVYRSSFEVRIAEFLHTLGIEFCYEFPLRLGKKTFVFPDFFIYSRAVDKEKSLSCMLEVTGAITPDWREAFKKKISRVRACYPTLPIVVLTYSDRVGFFRDLAQLPLVYVYGVGEPPPDELRTLVVRSDHFNFDYSHFLPWHKGQCADFHGHSSKIAVAVTGLVDDKGMVLDFSEVKAAVKESLAAIDHKVFVPKYTLRSVKNGRARILFFSKGRRHDLRIPASEIFVLNTDSTIENISAVIAESIMKKMPWNVTSVTVEVNEGVGKSCLAHSSMFMRDVQGVKQLASDVGDFLNVVRFHQVVTMRDYIPAACRGTADAEIVIRAE